MKPSQSFWLEDQLPISNIIALLKIVFSLTFPTTIKNVQKFIQDYPNIQLKKVPNKFPFQAL